MKQRSLLGLPAELNIKIFEQLPMRDVVKARGLCSEARDFLDSPDTRSALTRRAKEHELARLQETVDAVVYYVPDTDFLSALKAYVEHYGVIVPRELINITKSPEVVFEAFDLKRDDMIVSPFVFRWASVQSGSEDVRVWDPNLLSADFVAKAIIIQDLHLHTLPRGSTGLGHDGSDWLVPRDLLVTHCHLHPGLDEAWLDKTLETIRTTPGGIFRGLRLQVKEDRRDLALTGGTRFDDSIDFQVDMSWKDVHDLNSTLRVPMLPESCGFTYYARSKSTFDMIQKNEMQSCPYKTAAVLEDVELR